jgi:hypothetical protein
MRFELAGISLVVLNAVLWHAYRTGARRAGIAPLARRAIGRITVPLHVAGHALPVLLLATGDPALIALGGAAALAGGAHWKYSIVVGAGYQQGFALPRLPQRGSGRFAAPARLAVK